MQTLATLQARVNILGCFLLRGNKKLNQQSRRWAQTDRSTWFRHAWLAAHGGTPHRSTRGATGGCCGLTGLTRQPYRPRGRGVCSGAIHRAPGDARPRAGGAGTLAGVAAAAPQRCPPAPGPPGPPAGGGAAAERGRSPPLLRLRRATGRRQRPRLSPRGSGAGREELRARGREAATYPPSLRRRFGERPPEESPQAAEPC